MKTEAQGSSSILNYGAITWILPPGLVCKSLGNSGLLMSNDWPRVAEQERGIGVVITWRSCKLCCLGCCSC